MPLTPLLLIREPSGCCRRAGEGTCVGQSTTWLPPEPSPPPPEPRPPPRHTHNYLILLWQGIIEPCVSITDVGRLASTAALHIHRLNKAGCDRRGLPLSIQWV
jgi:hypothetical protein